MKRHFKVSAAMKWLVRMGILLVLVCQPGLADDIRPFLTPDSVFKGVEPPDWVLDGAVKVFVSLDDLAGISPEAR